MKRLLLSMMSAGILGWAGGALSADALLGDALKGQELFQQRCTMCHGDDGRGAHGTAPDFAEEWHRLTKTDDELAENIRNDFQGSERFYTAGSCPPHALNSTDMDDLLAYLRELSESMRSSDSSGFNPNADIDRPDDFGRRDDFDRRDDFQRPDDDFDRPFGIDPPPNPY